MTSKEQTTGRQEPLAGKAGIAGQRTALIAATALLAGCALTVTLAGPFKVPFAPETNSDISAPAPVTAALVRAAEPAPKGDSAPALAARKSAEMAPSAAPAAAPVVPEPVQAAAVQTPATATTAIQAPVEVAVPVVTAEASEPAPRFGLPTTAEQDAARQALASNLARLHLARTLMIQKEAEKAAQQALAAVSGTPVVEATGSIPQASAAASSLVNVARRQQDTRPIAQPEAPVQVASLEVGPEIIPAPTKRPKPLVREPAKASKPEPSKPAGPELAYANVGNPEDDGSTFGGLNKIFKKGKVSLPGRGSGIAVYEISSATVYMPDGQKLEAHSGIGHRMDNPKFSHVRMLGPTPPNVYKLRMRERRFHGVEAIRMLPQDRAAMKGRDGMLTHTRLLRNSIGSHGCVAFKNYNKFLSAFKAGKIHTMIVVPALDELPVYMASL